AFEQDVLLLAILWPGHQAHDIQHYKNPRQYPAVPWEIGTTTRTVGTQSSYETICGRRFYHHDRRKPGKMGAAWFSHSTQTSCTGYAVEKTSSVSSPRRDYTDSGYPT